MGAFTSRRNAGVEEVDYSTTNAYRYPPKSGCYFGSYFIMGGERFDTTQPEAYLFGENQDLNFLGNRPVPFPYPAPQANEPTKTLKSLVNIRKDSLKFVKSIEKVPVEAEAAEEPLSQTCYNIEFTFDSDVRVAITVLYFCTEEITNGQAVYHPRDPVMNSETYRYKRGANQTFCQSTHIIDPSKFPEEEWQYNPDKEVIPVVIQCVVEDEVEHAGHSHMTFGTVERSSDSGFVLKPLKQKQMVDGLCYLLQEIYGIENKNADRTKPMEDDFEDAGSECVICMSDVRDTLILPCRHLCLCNGCADSLRYQANNCPICRAPFRALLQIRAMRKKPPPSQTPQPASDSEENVLSQEGVPPGYEAVSLLEALNGPNAPSSNPLQVHHENVNPPVRAPSLPTSPEESPLMGKRKSKRQTSMRSNLSVRGAVVVEGQEAKETQRLDNDVPELIMTAHTPDPVKSPDSPKKIRYYPGSLSPTSPTEGEKISRSSSSLEIVNEVEPECSSLGADLSGDQRSLSSEPSAEGAGIVVLNRLSPDPESLPGAADATAGVDAHADADIIDKRVSTPLNDYDDEAEDEQHESGAQSARSSYGFQMPHTVVLDEGEEAELPESAPLCLASQQLVDNISLPGTPTNTDGSSYSSTSSTRVLLGQGGTPVTSKSDTETTEDEENPAV